MLRLGQYSSPRQYGQYSPVGNVADAALWICLILMCSSSSHHENCPNYRECQKNIINDVMVVSFCGVVERVWSFAAIII